MSATKHAQKIKDDSHKYLTEALFQLLERKSLSEIKVTELVKRAGVSRMAFYRNFDSLSDILHQFFTPRIAKLFDNVILEQPSSIKVTDMQDFFSSLTDELKLATKRDYEHIIRDLFTENMTRYYNTLEVQPNSFFKYWSVFMTHGVYGIWREWLLNGQDKSLPEMQKLIRELQTATKSVALKS